MVDDQQLALASGSLEMVISPSIGGSIRDLTFSGSNGLKHAVLRECHIADPNVLDMASFPLVPFVNRIRGGAFDFRGEEVRLRPNMAGDVSPLHGQGWLGSWTVDSADAGSAALRFVHQAGEWPWAYEAHQRFVLDEGGMSVTLTCTNTDDRPMPCGLGQHPYFPCGPQTRLETEVQTAWTIDEHVLPLEEVPAEGRFDLSDRLVCAQDLDHGFSGWGGSAQLSDPSWPFEIVLSSPTARFFQLYSPLAGGLFVAEPVSHANAALNAPEQQWAALGMQVLDPGASAELTMRLDVKPR